MKKSIIQFSVLISLLLGTQKLSAHCEIPCGIYGDSLRIALISEHITTIEKSMNKINELADKNDNNQLIRWVINKEEHAKKLQEIVSQYFLHQRIKPTDPANSTAYKQYIQKLELLHKLLVYSMKAKQSTDLLYIEKLRETLHSFEHAYFENHTH
ncbi:superoxide dismutase, Ni [Bacteroidales bacterium]|nr:superoxide dismutase, Ni [Bacteroidales bacterium]